MSPIDAARSQVRLVDFLVYALGEPKKVGGNLRWSSCPVSTCGPSKEGSHKVTLSGEGQYWRCFRCGGKGDVVAAAAAHFGCADLEAAKKLLEKSEKAIPRVDIVPVQDVDVAAKNQAMMEAFECLHYRLSGYWDERVADYLTHSRMLPQNLVRSAWKEKGILRMLPFDPAASINLLKDACGEDLLRASGLWRDGAKAPGVAFRPLIFFLPKRDSAEFRLARDPKRNEPKAIRYGHAELPWFWQGKANHYAIVEGAIDMVSMIAMGYEGSVIGLPGCNNWRDEWLTGYAGKKVHVVLDNDLDKDNPGQHWAKKLSTVLVENGAKVIIKSPPPGQDINDILKQKLAKAA